MYFSSFDEAPAQAKREATREARQQVDPRDRLRAEREQVAADAARHAAAGRSQPLPRVAGGGGGEEEARPPNSMVGAMERLGERTAALAGRQMEARLDEEEEMAQLAAAIAASELES